MITTFGHPCGPVSKEEFLAYLQGQKGISMPSRTNAGMLGHEKLDVSLSKTPSGGPNGLVFLCDALNISLGGRQTIYGKILTYSMPKTFRERDIHIHNESFIFNCVTLLWE